MPRIDEHLIEVYVRDPAVLTEAQRRAIEEALRDSAELRRVADYWRGYYEALADLPDVVSARVRAFVDDLFAPRNVIPLHAAPEPRMQDPAPGITVLAARTTPQRARRSFELVTALTSKRDETVVRIMRDVRRHRYHVFALAPPPHAHAFALLDLPLLPGPLLLDGKGQATFELSKEPEGAAWHQPGTALRRPIAVCMLRETAAQPLAPGCAVAFTIAGEDATIQVRRTTDAKVGAFAQAVAFDAAGRTRRVPLKAGQGMLSIADLEPPVTVRFYA